MSTYYVVMNRHIIGANRKVPIEERQPPVRVTRGKHGTPIYCDEITFHGPSVLLNGIGEAVMPCGASIALSTEAGLTLTTRGKEPITLNA